MSGGDQAAYVVAALVYAQRCTANGDAQQVRAIGLTAEAASLISSLSLEEARRLGKLCGKAISLSIDSEALVRHVQNMRTSREAESPKHRLLRAGASREMMAKLFGMSAREYSESRTALSIQSGIGRPPALDGETEEALWYEMKDLLRGNRSLTPEQIMEIHAKTGVSARLIWRYATYWAARDGGS